MRKIVCIALALALLVGSYTFAMAEGEIVLTWLNMPCGKEDDYNNFKNNLIAEFEASHPGVRIEQEVAAWNDGPNKIMAAILAGDGPDIVHMGSWTTAQVYSAGGALDITDVYDETFGNFEETFVNGGRALCEFQGRMYGVPWGGNSRAVLMRSDRLEKAGYPIASIPMDWTFDQFVEIMTALKGVDDVEYPVAVFGNADDIFFLWNAWTVARGGEGIGVYTPDLKTATVNSGASLHALRDMCDLIAKYKIVNPSCVEWDGSVVESNYLNGSVSCVLGSPDYGFTTTAQNMGITAVSCTRSSPTVDSGYSATLHLSVTAVMEYCEHPQEALEFVAFLNNAKNQAAFNNVAGWIPARMDSWKLDPRIDERMEGTLYGMEHGFCIMAGNSQAINIKTIMQRTINEALTKAATGGDYSDAYLQSMLDQANVDVQAELDKIDY